MLSSFLRNALVFGIIILAAVSASLAGGNPGSTLPETPLHITRDGAIIAEFHVEVANTPKAQEHGLMFRDTLAEDKGMLFLYATPVPAAMWMKNTRIPLDMLFIDADATIVHIHPDAEPHSLTPISAGRNVQAVLEIGGGVTAARGIRIGDMVSTPMQDAQE